MKILSAVASNTSINKKPNSILEDRRDSADLSDNVGSYIKSSHIEYSDFLNTKEITRLLNNSAESFVERLLGRPNERLSSAAE